VSLLLSFSASRAKITCEDHWQVSALTWEVYYDGDVLFRSAQGSPTVAA
jgi:hypothetical protein